MNPFFKLSACVAIILSASALSAVEEIAKNANTPEECAEAMLAITKTVKDFDSSIKAKEALAILDKKTEAFSDEESEQFIAALRKHEKEMVEEGKRIRDLNIFH